MTNLFFVLTLPAFMMTFLVGLVGIAGGWDFGLGRVWVLLLWTVVVATLGFYFFAGRILGGIWGDEAGLNLRRKIWKSIWKIFVLCTLALIINLVVVGLVFVIVWLNH